MDDLDYPGLDEALLPLHVHLAALMPPGEQHGLTVQEVHAEMPIELDILDRGDRLALGSSPPLYYVETGFPTARHRLRVTLVEQRLLFDDGRAGGSP
jgi:hypothetical protein